MLYRDDDHTMDIEKWDTSDTNYSLWRTTILYSLLRYVIFASNWILILWLLDSEATILISIRNISLFYLAVSVIPIFQLFDITLKWSVAAIVFEESLYDPQSIIIATTLIWFTNSISPTIVGCILLPFQNLKTSEN